MDLYCAFCIPVRSDAPERAVTIMSGIAVCYDHSYYVQDATFNNALALIKRDEVKPVTIEKLRKVS